MKTSDERPAHRQTAMRQTAVRWVLLLAALTMACQPPADDQPDNLIPEEKMAQVLTDIHLTEARVNKLGMPNTDSSALVYKRLEAQVFTKHGIDTAAYRESYGYYAANPDRLARIYKNVVSRLEKKKPGQKAPTL